MTSGFHDQCFDVPLLGHITVFDKKLKDNMNINNKDVY